MYTRQVIFECLPACVGIALAYSLGAAIVFLVSADVPDVFQMSKIEVMVEICEIVLRALVFGVCLLAKLTAETAAMTWKETCTFTASGRDEAPVFKWLAPTRWYALLSQLSLEQVCSLTAITLSQLALTTFVFS
jgi:hypothetical protein